jgi:beta-aspartyl-peptidase (threonine type)
MIVSSCLFLGLLLAPAQAGQESEDVKNARKAIAKVLDDQVEAWNRGDLKSFMAGYHRSGDITFYSGGTVQKGWDAVFERYQKKYQGDGKEMGKVTFRDIAIDILGPDSAVVRGRWELKLTDEMPSGLFTLVFRKTSAGWRIVHDHTSNG